MSSATLLAAVAGGTGLAGLLVLGSKLGGPLVERMRVRQEGLAAAIRRSLEQVLGRRRRPVELELRGWIALKRISAVIAAVGAFVLGAALPGRIALLLMLALPVGGFLAPDAWLARLERRRLEAAVRDLPDMLDLFRVTIEAGMPPTRALGVVAEEFDGPLASEWKRISAEVTLGVPQEDALRELSRRLPAEAISLFVESLSRGRRHGVPLGRLLAAQASRARQRRAQDVREQAARAGPKIQLVVALLLVPAVLLLVAAGVTAELERSGLLLP